MVKTRHLFISHSWNHSGHYETVKEFLEDAPRFDFVNHSVPKDDPIQTEPEVPWVSMPKTPEPRTPRMADVFSQYASSTTEPEVPCIGKPPPRLNPSLKNIQSAVSQYASPTTEPEVPWASMPKTPEPRIPQRMSDAFLPSTSPTLRDAIKAKIDKSDIVLVIAGVYASYSKWIDIEIDIAQESNTPILAIEYWGAERTSAEVKAAANKVVRWSTSSIVTAIRDLVP